MSYFPSRKRDEIWQKKTRKQKTKWADQTYWNCDRNKPCGDKSDHNILSRNKIFKNVIVPGPNKFQRDNSQILKSKQLLVLYVTQNLLVSNHCNFSPPSWECKWFDALFLSANVSHITGRGNLNHETQSKHIYSERIEAQHKSMTYQ